MIVRSSGSIFLVDLGEVRLAPLIERRVENEIHASVLRGMLDSGAAHETAWELQARIDEGYSELVSAGSAGWPWSAGGGQPLAKGLEIRHHTLIIQSLMDNALAVLRILKQRGISSRPSDSESLQILLETETIEDSTREVIREALRVLDLMNYSTSSSSLGDTRMVDDLRAYLATEPSIERKIRRLHRSQRSESKGLEGHDEVLDVVEQILIDGASTIYDYNNNFYRMLYGQDISQRGALSDMADSDAVGGAMGAAAGLALAGVGAAAGGVAGAAGASAGAGLAHVIAAYL